MLRCLNFCNEIIRKLEFLNADRSSPHEVNTLAGTDETANTCMVYKAGDNDAVVEQRRKAKKETNDESQQYKKMDDEK